MAVPSPLSVKVTPVGRDPVWVSAAVGLPVEVTVNVPAAPWLKVAVLAEVMVGAACTVKVKDCTASEPTPLEASNLIGYTPPAVGVPARVAVPLPLLVKVTPVGRVPLSAMEGVGVPVDVTVKVPAVPLVKVLLAAEVMVGAASTVKVKDWVASEPTPLEAFTVMG